MRSHLLSLGLTLAVALPATAEDATEHPGRRERSTPGLVLETGARTAACDVLLFTADVKHLLAAGDDKVVRTWAVTETGQLRPTALPVLRWPIFREARGNIYTAALSPDESRIVVAGHGRLSGGFAAAVIDRKTGAIRHGTDNPTDKQQGTVWASAFSPSGKRVALGTITGAVWLWELASGKLTQIGTHEPRPGGDPWLMAVRMLAFDGEDRVISVGGNDEMTAWNVGEPGHAQRLHRFSGPISTPAVLSPDGKWVGAIPERPGRRQLTVELVSFPDAKRSRILRFEVGDFPHRLAFSPSSRYLAVAVRHIGQPELDPGVTFYQERGGRVLIFDLTQPDGLLTPVAGPEQGLYAEGLAFHPRDEHRLAVAGGDNHEVILWDWKAGRKLGEVPQPGRSLWGVALSADGTTVAFQDHRHHAAPHPNRRGTGPWRYFSLDALRFVDDTPFEPNPRAQESADGWKVVTMSPESTRADRWFVESPTGKRFPLPWSRTQDEFPRCYTFLPGNRLAVGHYWGASVFDLTEDGPRRTRILQGHEGYVTAVAASADGKRLVTASRDMTLAGWSLEDWPHHPQLGAELFQRGGRLVVGKVSAGSPLWEVGLTSGDTIEAVIVADHTQPGQATAKIVYDRRDGEEPAGTPAAATEFLRAGSRAGTEHLFYWRSPGDPKLYKGLTTVLDRPLWRFFPHDEREWVLWRWRDYYYDCSVNGDFQIGWQRSHPLATLRTPDFFRAEQFRGEFLRPDRVKQTLSSWRNEPELIRFTSIEPPDVSVSEPRPASGGHEVTITATATGSLDAQQPGRLLVWLNDYLLTDRRGEGLPVENGTYRGTVHVPADRLRNGLNIVVAQCYGRGGARADSAPQRIVHESVFRKQKLHAFLVGVGDYSRAKPRQPRLRSVEDVRVLARAFGAQSGRLPFEAVEVKTLINKQASREAILAELDALRDRVRPDDLLVFHLGGHGTSLPELQRKEVAPRKLAGLGRFLFLCGDFDLDRMPDTTVSFEDLHDRLSRLPCHKLMLLDACHSGEARTSGGDTDANPVRILTRHGIGCTILAACGPDEEAIENDAIDLVGGGHGLFAIAIRRLLEDRKSFTAADDDANGLLDASELARGVTTQVQALVAGHNALLRRLGEPGDDRQAPVAFVPRLEEATPVAAQESRGEDE